jgi:hypothetical protein
MTPLIYQGINAIAKAIQTQHEKADEFLVLKKWQVGLRHETRIQTKLLKLECA